MRALPQLGADMGRLVGGGCFCGGRSSQRVGGLGLVCVMLGESFLSIGEAVDVADCCEELDVGASVEVGATPSVLVHCFEFFFVVL